MIPIKINNIPYKIKSIADLTTSEFIELSKIEDCDTVKYIAWQTGVSMADSFFAVSSKVLDQAIGTAPDITKLKPSKKFIYSKTIDTVGQRHQVEACKYTSMELLVYCLAVAQARSNNSDDVDKLYSSYMSRPFEEILPAGFFFFKKYRHGSDKGLSFSRILQFLIKIARIRRLRVLKGLVLTLIT